MGAAQSTRKITLVNDDKAGVIKLSESLAHRLRGQLEEQQYRQHQRLPEPPVGVAEPDPLPTPILTPPPVDLPPPPPPTLETAKIPSLIPEAPPAEAQTQAASAAPDIPPEPVIPTATEPLQVPEPISITPEPVVTLEPPVVQEPVVAAEPIKEAEPLVVPEPVVPEPLVVAEPVVVEPVAVVEPSTIAEPVITESISVVEPVVTEPAVEVEPVTVEPLIVAEPVIEAEPVAEAVTEPSLVIAGEPEPTLAAAFPEPLSVTPGASATLDVAAVAADIAAAAVTSPAPAATTTTAEVAEAVPEAAPVEAEPSPPSPPVSVAVPDVGSAVQAGAGPTLTAPSGTIPPWSIYAEEAHLMVMRLKAEKDQEIKKLSDEWRAKLDQREEEFVKTSALTEENFTASLKEVEAMFVKATCDPVCQNQQEEVMKCYQDHPHQSLRCAREVSQFAQCVDLSRLQAVMKQN